MRTRIEQVKQDVAKQVAASLREQPEALSRLSELGLLDEAGLRALESGGDLRAVIFDFRDGIAELARTEPSVLQQLELRPLDLLVDERSQVEAPSDADEVTVVFADLEGFTSFNAREGDAEATALLRDHYDAVEDIVAGRGGKVVKTLGDGHMMRFVTPSSAVLAGLDLVDAAPGPLRVRVGGHVGPVVRAEGDLLGNAVNLAARVTDLAAGGEQMVTAAVRDAAGSPPGCVFGDVAPVEIRGFQDPVGVCSVVRG